MYFIHEPSTTYVLHSTEIKKSSTLNVGAYNKELSTQSYRVHQIQKRIPNFDFPKFLTNNILSFD